MSLFVEVNSVEKECPVIINLEHVVEIAPLRDGGCILYTADSAGMNSRVGIKVADNFELFKQFALQTVTVEDIANKFPKATKTNKKEDKEKFGIDFADIPTLTGKK